MPFSSAGLSLYAGSNWDLRSKQIKESNANRFRGNRRLRGRCCLRAEPVVLVSSDLSHLRQLARERALLILTPRYHLVRLAARIRAVGRPTGQLDR